MISHDTKIRVRYNETDQMGVVHHSAYITYFEVGRTDLIRSMGKTYSSMEKEGIMLPVISLHCNYSGPAYYDDELIVRTSIKENPGVKVRFDYEIYNNEIKICDGYAILAFTNAITRKPSRPPVWFVKLFGDK